MTGRMPTRKIEIDPVIERATTLPAEVYTDPDYFDLQLEQVFARAWLFADGREQVSVPGQVCPLQFQPGGLSEPLLLARDPEDTLRCLSNVCTHRGNLLVEGPGRVNALRCRYHGRRFKLDGSFAGMPEFDGAEDFPSAADDLPRVPIAEWGPLLFASLRPAVPFADVIAPAQERLAWIDWDSFTYDPETSRTYLVEANWALYCENYLEGFHVPYVHPGLATALDYGAYTTEVYDYASLQLGIAAKGEPTFALPEDHPDAERGVAAYYYWLFPATMLNIYPWGLSLNVIEPLSHARTRVRFLAYVRDASLHEVGAGAGLDRVEREDEDVVEAVQLGVRSRLYQHGRYSPRREKGVHQFHRLLARFMNGE